MTAEKMGMTAVVALASSRSGKDLHSLYLGLKERRGGVERTGKALNWNTVRTTRRRIKSRQDAAVAFACTVRLGRLFFFLLPWG